VNPSSPGVSDALDSKTASWSSCKVKGFLISHQLDILNTKNYHIKKLICHDSHQIILIKFYNVLFNLRQ
jgi:hypothetical protein